MADRLSLSGFGWDIGVSPEFGACLTHCRFDQVDVLRPAESYWAGDPMQSAQLLLLPFSNRISGGKFEFDGRKITLKANSPVDPLLPIHGMGWQRAWEVTDQSQHRLMLSLSHSADEWPWDFRAELELTVGVAGFSQTLALTNLSEAPMPYGFGFHPYFKATCDTQITFKANGFWRSGADKVPTEWAAMDAENDFSNSKPLADCDYDTNFTGWSGLAGIQHANGNVIHISASDNLIDLVLYTPPGEYFFCLEPVSHMIDAFNQSETIDALGQGETAMCSIVIDSKF